MELYAMENFNKRPQRYFNVAIAVLYGISSWNEFVNQKPEQIVVLFTVKFGNLLQ